MNIKKSLVILFILFFSFNHVHSEIPHFLDFKKILNQSSAGKKAQDYLKNKLENGIKDLKKREKTIQDEEKKIIQQKKVISPEDYKKKVGDLRKKVSELQKNRNELLQSVAKERKKARDELLKNLNPILKEYMQEKKIRIVLDKKNILAGDEGLEITKDVMILLDKKLKSIKLN
jgi:outer membrane protein